MASRKRPYFHLFNFALFGVFTLWTAVTDPRLTPGFAALAIAQGAIAIVVLGRPSAQAPALVILGFLGASYFGLAYFPAAIAGAPNTTRFWLIFIATAAIFAPVVLVAWLRRGTWTAKTRASARGESRHRG